MLQEKIIKMYFQAWLDKDGTLLSQIFAEDAVYSECYGPEYLGLSQIRKWFSDWNRRGTVLEWRIKRFIHQGSVSVAEWYFKCEYDRITDAFDGVSIIEFDENMKISGLREFQSKAEHVCPYWSSENVILREYRPSDCKELTELFFRTVHTVNAKDYTEEQLDAWTGQTDPDRWNQTFLEHCTIVAAADGIIVGFGDIDRSGYLDRLYVHSDYQGRGIATALCDHLEKMVQGRITVHASITARPFFEKRGYRVIKEQQVVRLGVSLKNYVMEKRRDSCITETEMR